MKVKIADDFETFMEMSVGHALLCGVLADFLIEAGVIDRAPLVERLERRRLALEDQGCEGEAWSIAAVETALRQPLARQGRGSVRLALVRGSEESSRDSASGPR